MSQWSIDRAALSARHPDERWVLTCPEIHRSLLQQFDHHTVWLESRLALLLTAPHVTEAQPDPSRFRFQVSFTYAKGHSPAPREVQDVLTREAVREAQ